MGYVIVPVGPADAEELAQVHVQAWRETYRGLLPSAYLDSMSAPAHARRVARALTFPRPGDVALAAAERDGLVGYVAGGAARSRREGEGEIASLYLLRPAQGKGLGRALVTAAARTLAANGATSLVISVLRDNLRARAFYEHLGGEAEAPRPERGPGGVLLEVNYRWPDIGVLT